jgi:hypothetical protein
MNKIMLLQFLGCFAVSLYFTMIFLGKMIQIHALIIKGVAYRLPDNWLLAWISFMWACTAFAWIMK